MKLILAALLNIAWAIRPVEDILGDMRIHYQKTHNLNYTYANFVNENALQYHNQFDVYDVYSQSIDAEDTNYNISLDNYGSTNFEIALGDLPELRGDFIEKEQNRTIADTQIEALLNELNSQKSNPRVKRTLGDIYAFGHYNIPVNIELSHKFYLQVIESAHSEDVDLAHSHFMLGAFFATGVLSHHEQSHSKALIHYKLAYELGSIQASMALAHKYQYGIGVTKDENLALLYYSGIFYETERLLEPQKLELNTTRGIKRDLVYEPRYDKFSFRVGDFFGGLYPDSISRMLPSLRFFLTIEKFQHISGDLNEDELSIPSSEVKLNEQQFEYFMLTEAYFKGDYLHSRNFKLAAKNAELCIANAFKNPDFTSYLSMSTQSAEKPDWVLFTGRCYLYLSTLYFRGDGVALDYKLAMEYSLIGAKLTKSRQFETIRAIMWLYGLGTELNLKNASEYWEDENKSLISSIFIKLLSELDELDDSTPIGGEKWANLSYVSSYHVHLAERKQIELWLNGRYPVESADNIVSLISSYVKLYEPIFFNFKETFFAGINGDNWKTLMGLMIQSELGYEHAQASLGVMLYPTVGKFSNKKFRYQADTYKAVYTKTRFLEAIKYFDLSAKHGNSDSMNFLGDLYYYGLSSNPPSFYGDENISSYFFPVQSEPETTKDKVVKPDMIKSISHYHDAASAGSAMASYNIGWAYEYGVGESQDLHLAKRYYDTAVGYKKIGYISVKCAILRIKIKAKVWSFLGWDGRGIRELRDSTSWYDRFFRVLNWAKTNNEIHDEL